MVESGATILLICGWGGVTAGCRRCSSMPLQLRFEVDDRGQLLIFERGLLGYTDLRLLSFGVIYLPLLRSCYLDHCIFSTIYLLGLIALIWCGVCWKWCVVWIIVWRGSNYLVSLDFVNWRTLFSGLRIGLLRKGHLWQLLNFLGLACCLLWVASTFGVLHIWADISFWACLEDFEILIWILGLNRYLTRSCLFRYLPLWRVKVYFSCHLWRWLPSHFPFVDDVCASRTLLIHR